jgi:hypothetical protein
MENEIEQVQEVVEETQEEVIEEVQEESVEELKKRLATLEAQKEHWRDKANKTVEVKPSPRLGLSAGDLMAIKNADIEEKDMDLVEKFANDNGLPLREALHHPHMKAILAYEKEVRTTSVATNVENVRRGAVKVTDDTLISNAMNNKLPTTDDEIEQLIHAKFKRR